ncbi:MAG: acyltransferase, partial [Planctomycetota bacterium]
MALGSIVTTPLARWARSRALGRGKSVGLWTKLTEPSLEDWALYLKRHGGFYSFGEHCAINYRTMFTDPAYTRIGNNVRIAGAHLFGHDGSVNMINRAFGTKIDKVGKVDIGNDVFIGIGAMILPGVTIGDRVIVGALSVVSSDIEPDSVVVGSPAKRICSLTDYVAKLET